MVNELERIWKEAAVAWFKVLYRHLPGGTRENYEKYQDSLSPGRDLAFVSNTACP
jgi:hypothetical protein